MNDRLILHPETGSGIALDARTAIGSLMADHRQVEALFADLAAAAERSVDEKYAIAKAVCGDLLIHMAIEETYFYPAVRGKIADGNLIDGPHAQHDRAKELIIQLGGIRPDDPRFGDKMTLLSQEVASHVDEEENILFPQVRASDLDLTKLGDTLRIAKRDMRANLGLDAE